MNFAPAENVTGTVMAQIKVNGETENFDENMTLENFLRGKNLPQNFVAELNGEIISKKDYSSTVLKDKDTLELAAFCAGG